MSELSFSESENGEEPEETPQEELLEEPEPEVLPPKKVKIRSVVSKKEGQAVIKWKAVECDRYQVRYARDKNFTVSVVQKNVSAKSKSLTVKGLEKGKKYYFQVRAQNNKKNKKTGKIKRVSGEWSDTVKVKIHKHHYKLDSYLTPCAGVEYTACYKCSCGSAYYKTKTNKGKIYDGIITRMPSCIQGIIKSTPKSKARYIPAVSTHAYSEVDGQSVCSKCGQLLNYIDTEYIDEETNTSTNVEFTAPKNTNSSTSVALSVKNQAGVKLKYKLYYQKATALEYKYPKYKSYLKSHGCSTCALTAVLNATVPKYKNYTPDMVIEKVIRPSVGEQAFKANFSKSLRRQMPIGLKGIAKVLEDNGVQYKYVHKYTTESATKEIKAHLESGNPVIFTVPKSTYSNGVHTMCMLSLDKNGRVIVGDSIMGSAKKWGKNNRLVKFNTTSSSKSSKVSKICKFFNASTKNVDKVGYFYSGRKGNIGYILVWKE
ncbi:MAG: fibronectin type III domain-containing protein [Eubacterium sp.]|nr:fibronectin type III domain-containing protein [Eubacterium sp.]